MSKSTSLFSFDERDDAVASRDRHRERRLPNAETHQSHAEGQPAEESDRNNRFKTHRRIRSFLRWNLSGVHARSIGNGWRFSKSFIFLAKTMPSIG